MKKLAGALCAIGAGVALLAFANGAAAARAECDDLNAFCTEVYDSIGYGGSYTGHDEPALLFYSSRAGSGNNQVYKLRLPADPPNMPQQDGTGGTWNFQLHPAFWFGLALCDSQSYPEYTTTCNPDTDTNIKNDPNPASPNFIGKHAGTAFMEMQFYPPGWVNWPLGNSCSATQWCAALNIDSFSQSANTGAFLNSTCSSLVGVEPVNFAFITKSGTPQPGSPPDPIDATLSTYTPNPSADLFMNSGDLLTVAMRDTFSGFHVDIIDRTTHQAGSMTASAANGFGQVEYDPAPSTACVNIPYNFHPMYSTSSENTRVIWAAHSYNVAFADEIGHFDLCGDSSISVYASCSTTEGFEGEAADSDDTFCLDQSLSSLVPVSGCIGTNSGFDGSSYQEVWPGTDPNPSVDRAYHPTPIQFTSPTFSGGQQYSRVAFEADLPRIEFSTCNRSTGVGCTSIPQTDDGNPAFFYPIFSTGSLPGGHCIWQIGGTHIPGTTNTFGGGTATEFGGLLQSVYAGTGNTTFTRFNNFRNVLDSNPCPA
jgi:hypothetical protein